MHTKDYEVFVNGLYLLRLHNSDHYGDRPEPYREHERSLWILFNLVKNGHEIAMLDASNHVVATAHNADELLAWFGTQYPQFIPQLDQDWYTRRPHPNDLLANRHSERSETE
jgi:hypothetical protein